MCADLTSGTDSSRLPPKGGTRHPGRDADLKVVRGATAAKAGLRGATRQVVVGRYRVPWGGDI